LIKRSFQGLSIAIETVRIVEELVEIWPNEVCDTLPLIMELINNIDSKKVFTKMDLRWGFNNMRIKEGDEWKGAFTIYMGSFEPIVMFFGITNLLATF